jgi:hypothetical protein
MCMYTRCPRKKGDIILSAILGKNSICTCVLFRMLPDNSYFTFVICKHVLEIFTTLLQCHYQQSQRVTNDSHAGKKIIFGAKSKLLYSEIVLSRKLFGIGYMYVHTLLLKMTDIMTSQNIVFSSWDILYNVLLIMFKSRRVK